jgi:hypothetical protein
VHPRIKIEVKLIDDNSEVHCNIQMNTKLGRVFAAYCARKALALDSVRFRFDGMHIPSNVTAEDFGLEDGDRIDAMMIQM